MQRLALRLLTVALGIAAAPAQAGVLSTATWVENAFGVPIDVPVIATGTSTQTSVSVSLQIPEFTFQIVASLASVPSAATLTRVSLWAEGSAMISAGPSMAAAVWVGAETRFDESVRVAFRADPQGIFYTWYRLGLRPGTQSPPTSPQFFILLGSTISEFPDFYGWTPGAATLAGLTSMGVAMPDAKAQGAFNLNALGAGTVTLVAPRRISVQGAFPGVQRTVGSFTTLTLHFVPEPSASLLLAAAGAAFLLRRARARR